MKLLNRTILVIFSLCSTMCFAGGPSVSSITGFGGYFLGTKESVYITPEAPYSQVYTITSVCNKNGDVWASSHAEILKCTGVDHKFYGSNLHEIKINIEWPESNTAALHEWVLYSVEPFSEQTWLKRHITPTELQNIERFIESVEAIPSLKKEKINRIDLKPDDIYVIEQKIKLEDKINQTLYVVPYESYITEWGNTVYNNVILSVDQKGRLKFISRMIKDAILLPDITNADGVPEFLYQTSCDGRCVYVKDIVRNEIIVSIEVH